MLAPEEKFLLKALELEAGGANKLSPFQDLGRAYGIATTDHEALLGPLTANEARTKLVRAVSKAVRSSAVNTTLMRSGSIIVVR